MTIDTLVLGDPAQVRAAAEWLDPQLKDGADGSSLYASTNSIGARSEWWGEAGAAYASILGSLYEASTEARDAASDAAEKLRSYAGQLERMESDFAAHRENAANNGIPVSGTIISPPVCLVPVCPTSRDDPYWDDWQAFQDQVKLYNRIAEDVGSWWGELEVWVAENIDAFVAALAEKDLATRILDGLRGAPGVASDMVTDTYLEYTKSQWELNAQHFRETAQDLRAEADGVARGLRSGNPAVRAAAEAANPTDLRATAQEFDDYVSKLGKAGKVLPIVEWGVDIWEFGTALNDKDDPSSTAVEIAGGVAGGLAVTGLVAAGVITLPAWGTAAAVAGAGIAVGAGASWAYENWVPQDVRESIDAGLEHGWDATKDFAEDAWDNTGEFFGDVGHNVGRAWKSVFG